MPNRTKCDREVAAHSRDVRQHNWSRGRGNAPWRTLVGALALLLVMLPLSACSIGAQTGSSSRTSGTAQGVSASDGTPTSVSGGPIRVADSMSITSPQTDQLAEKAVDTAAPSVVLVKTDQALGSGVILTGDGYIVTNHHVVANAHQVAVTFATGTSVPAQVRGVDSLDDLAILKVDRTHLPAATFFDSSHLQVGQTVLAMGNPLGITRTVTEGIISALARTVNEGQGGGRIANAIQTSAPINPGNSGGALINLDGQVVGIPTLTAVDPEFSAPAQGIGFAIPSNKVVSIATQVIEHGKVEHTGQAAVGIRAAGVTPQLAQQYGLPVDHGVLVAGTISGGPAARAGLKNGDIIVKVDRTQITTDSDLLNLLSRLRPGDTVSVTYVTEGGARKTTRVKLGELPANATG